MERKRERWAGRQGGGPWRRGKRKRLGTGTGREEMMGSLIISPTMGSTLNSQCTKHTTHLHVRARALTHGCPFLTPGGHSLDPSISPTRSRLLHHLHYTPRIWRKWIENWQEEDRPVGRLKRLQSTFYIGLLTFHIG